MQRLSGVALLATLLTACGSQTTVSHTYSHPVTPTPRPTVQVGFDVAITPQATRTKKQRVRQPPPTPFVAPHGPYLRLWPNSGPPLATTILVQGGHLPGSSEIEILWSPRGHKSAVARAAYSDPRGNLSTEFEVPAADPGTYWLSAEVTGVVYATARYRVRSPASLDVRVSSTEHGESLRVIGRRFIPRLGLVLIAYPIDRPGKPVLLGTVRTNRAGSFLFPRTTRRLSPGQYMLRAWSTSALSAQMAEAFFEVMI